MKISLIAAVAQNGVIGVDGRLPWNIPGDLKRFKELTIDKAVIMGRKTFESIGKPLPNRFNLVITSNKKYLNDARAQDLRIIFVPSLDSAISVCRILKFDEVFIAGGAGVYKEALESELVSNIYLTRVHKDFEGDTYFYHNIVDPAHWEIANREVHEEKDLTYSFIDYKRAM